MKRFQVGDDVRVSDLPNSQWQDLAGTIVEIRERHSCGEAGMVQECAVKIAGELRWFMADHLVKTVSTKWVRFFQTEAMYRWKLDPNAVGSLTGDREQLAGVLRDRLGFTMRRAQTEVDEFYTMFNERITRVIDVPAQHGPSESGPAQSKHSSSQTAA